MAGEFVPAWSRYSLFRCAIGQVCLSSDHYPLKGVLMYSLCVARLRQEIWQGKWLHGWTERGFSRVQCGGPGELVPGAHLKGYFPNFLSL